MSQENVELVRALYAEWERGNFGAMADLYAPDVEWHWSSGARALRGGSASYKGLAEIVPALREWVKEWGWWSIRADDFTDAGDRVLVMTTIHARLKDGRGEVSDRQVDVITVREGMIARMEVFDTEAEALKAVGLRDG